MIQIDTLGARLISILAETKRCTHNDRKSIIELALKTSEEVGELAEAVLCYGGVPGTLYKNYEKKTLDHLVEEAADVILCAAATAMKATGDSEWLLTKLEAKLVKWDRVIREIK